MKKIKLTIAIALIASFSLVQTGCIGSFPLTKMVLDFNRDMGNKFVEEAVFLAFLILPVYEATTIVDALVLNLVEFWTGDQLLGQVNDNGEEIDIKKSDNFYTLQNNTTGEQLKVYYDAETNAVFAETNNKLLKLVELNEETNEALVYLPDGNSKNIDLTDKSINDIRDELNFDLHYALK